MNLIVAVNNNSYIGLNGGIPWKSKSDFKHFKEMTMGGILILGSRTFEDDLRKRKLPGREMVIVGREYNTLYNAVSIAIKSGLPIWVIGGKTIYEQLIPLVENIHISYIDDDTIGDTKFEIPNNYRGVITKYYFEKD